MRGLAILAVILYHAHLQVSIGLGSGLGVLSSVDAAIRPFRMPVLMFLSGLLLPISLSKSREVYLKGKVFKIAWPYVVWSFINLSVLAAASSIRGASIGAQDFLKVFYSPPTYHWYLAYLFIFYLIAFVLVRLPHLRTLSIPFSLGIAMIVGDDWRRAFFLWVFFMAGDTVSRWWSRIRKILESKFTVGICALATLPALIVSSQGYDVRYDPIWAVSVVAGVFALIPTMKALTQTSVGLPLGNIGRNSLVYYVVHYLTITVVFHILVRFGVSNAVVLFLFSVSAPLTVGSLLVRIRDLSVVAWLFEWAPRRSR